MSAEMPETRICTEFTRGALVWAHLKGYHHWPAIVIYHPKENERKSSKYVLFFGTKDHAWIKKCNLYPYDDFYDKYSAVEDPKLYTAVKAVERYRRELLTDVLYNKHSNEDLKENTRKHWLVHFSNEAIEEVENEKKRQKLKRKKTPGKDSNQSRRKPKMSPSKDVRKEPQRTGKPGANVRFQVSKKHKMYSFAKYARKESKLNGKHKANKADLKKNTSRENSAQSCKTSKKPEIAVSTKNSKRGPKHSKTPEASNKSGMEKCSFKGNSVRPRKASAKPKTSASARNLRREPKRTSKPQVIIKKSKIRYMPSSGSSFVFPGPSTSARVPEIANGRIVYDTDCQRRSFIRGPLQPVQLTLGFVGIGELASALVSHLVRVGIHVLIWNRTASKCADLVRLGAILANTPADVAAESDIVFCSVRGTGPITEVCFGGFFVGLNGIVAGLKRNTRSEKGFVMLSSIRPETSMIIAQDFRKVSTKYLEAQALLKSQSEDCDIRVLCAGSKSLFEKLPNCFACTKAQFIYISTLLGEASRMKYAHTITHVGYALSLIEALAVLQESEKPVESLSFILDELDNVSPIMRNKIKDIIFHRRDLGGTIRELKDTLKELYEWYPKKPLHLATAAFEALEYASRKGADNRNISAMYDLLV